MRYAGDRLCILNLLAIGVFFSLLEVGALKPDNYAPCSSWITTTPIDLRSRHPCIIEQDFLAMDVDEHTERWDIISLSLVVNFVPEPKDRGESFPLACLAILMYVLARANAHLGTYIPASVRLVISRCKSLGCTLWLCGSTGRQLPSPCVENSRYMSFERLELLMTTIGFVEVEKKWRQGGKMVYWLYRKMPADGPLKTDGFRKKTVCRQGRRNNFCILLG
ncbi:hypothetical protein J3R83DRAFT_1640 [Lanmaoa asiatica]|nr:hypothetical protein J3R83DRAFT_1640 [Lanmaoa asiatica]